MGEATVLIVQTVMWVVDLPVCKVKPGWTNSESRMVAECAGNGAGKFLSTPKPLYFIRILAVARESRNCIGGISLLCLVISILYA